MSIWHLCLLFNLEGLLFIALSIPLAQRRIGPNRWYGFRTRKTLGSSEIWYPANAYAGRLLCNAGFKICLTALLFAVIPGMNVGTYTIVQTAVILLLLFGAVIKSFLYISKL